MDNELGARIRTLRKERGLSQEALALYNAPYQD